jgi:ATP-dependent protease ClpP protease subunit
VSDVLERDRFFTPEQARDYGLVDQVMTYRNGYSPSSS